MKAVLDTKVSSAYDDDIARRYHFPARYLGVLASCINDWVVFRQPRAAGGSLAYFAAGRVADIVEDQNSPQHHYATIRDYLPFDEAVPWLKDGEYAERALRELPNVSQLGLFLRGRSVRPLDADDFLTIVQQGYEGTWAIGGEVSADLGEVALDLLAVKLDALSMEQRERSVVSRLLNRKLRDRNFRRAVCSAYKGRCAISGLELRDVAGRHEAQGAHILPVSKGGPDIVSNGISLSATIHWLFDRHIISLDDNMGLMIAPEYSLPNLWNLLGKPGKKIDLPINPKHHPDLEFIAHHRREFQRLHEL